MTLARDSSTVASVEWLRTRFANHVPAGVSVEDG